MSRRRTVRRRVGRPLKTVKYSNETTCFANPVTIAAGTADAGQVNATMISAVNVQGMRKAKNFTLRIVANNRTPIAWALVYVPQGQNPSVMGIGTPAAPVSLYEPNQNVIMAGVLPIAGTPEGASNVSLTFSPQVSRTRLARNLNSGDTIVLCFRNLNNLATTFDVQAMLNYAITF